MAKYMNVKGQGLLSWIFFLLGLLSLTLYLNSMTHGQLFGGSAPYSLNFNFFDGWYYFVSALVLVTIGVLLRKD